MKWYFFAIIIILLLDIQSSVKKLANQIDNRNKMTSPKASKKSLILENYLGKKVCLEIDNEDISNSYLFSSTLDTIGEIVEYDNEWILFQYYSKQKKKVMSQYFRRKDVTSINEISTNYSEKEK